MHELSVAQDIVEQVLTWLEANPLDRPVVALHLRIGRLRAVMPEQLAFGFEVLSEGTPLQGVRLVIEEIQPRAACRSCGAEDDVNDIGLICARCASPDVEIRAGRELEISALEVQEEGEDD